MKIAIISDIHGNLDALNSVLKNIEKEKCEKIFCLGDLAMAGPEPKETISKIQSLIKDEKLYTIQGNTDEMLSVFSFDTYNKTLELNPVMGSVYLADSQLLSEEEKSFLAKLPAQFVTEIAGVKILCVHGSPRKNNENIFPDMPVEQVEEMIQGTTANVIFCGHTHTPCGYQTNTNQTVVNVGSVGRPFTANPDSCYAIMTIDETNSTFKIEHKFVKYDKESAAEKVRKRGFDGAEKLAKMLIKPQTRYPQ